MNDGCTSSSSQCTATASKSGVLPTYRVRSGVMFPDWSAVTSPEAKAALLAIIGSDHVLNRWNGYDTATDRVQVALLQLYAEQGRAPTAGLLARRVGLSELEVRSLLEELRRRDLVVLDGERIAGAYPFTDRDTGHRVTLEQHVLNAMCAVDALGIGAMTNRDVTIASTCRHCDAPIRITTRDGGRALGQAEPRTAVMWKSVRYEGACAANSLCATTAFFCSDDHLSARRREASGKEAGFRLSIEEGLEAGRALFGPILAGVDSAERAGGIPAAALTSVGSDSRIDSPASRVYINPCNSAYDLIVIGAGSAGFSAAITAADQGAQVALIGSGTIGGTCTNIGCVPSKALIRAAEALHNTRAAARFAGITAEPGVIEWGATVRQKDALVAELRQAKYTNVLPAYDRIAYREGPARLVEGGTEVNGAYIRSGRIIIATGARPTVPAVPGIDAVPYLTSTTALDLKELPQSLLVMGGGYIGVELAQMFARAGVKVTLVCRSHLLPKAEPEISAALTGYFADEGITVISGIAYCAIRKTRDGIALTVARGREHTTIDADQVLIATGRTPNVEGLALAKHGVALSPDGGTSSMTTCAPQGPAPMPPAM